MPLKNKYSTDKTAYNTTNHARMLYSLALCERELNITEFADRRRTSARYFVERYVKPIGYGRYAAISDPQEENLKCEKAKLSSLPTRLEDALDALEADHDYLTAGGVFPEQLIKNFIAMKRKECAEMSKIPHPAEFDRYFNL